MEDSENLNKIEIIVFDDDNRSLCKLQISTNSNFLYISHRDMDPQESDPFQVISSIFFLIDHSLEAISEFNLYKCCDRRF